MSPSSSSSSTTRPLPVLTLSAAKRASAACESKAQSLGIDFNIAIVDATLQLLHFMRMPNAKLTSIHTAIDKAFTAAGHRAPTSTYSGKNFLPGGPAYGIHNSNGGRFMLIGGGVPILVDGVVVGAIGVSTGTPAQDEEVALAGVEEIERAGRRREGGKL